MVRLLADGFGGARIITWGLVYACTICPVDVLLHTCSPFHITGILTTVHESRHVVFAPSQLLLQVVAAVSTDLTSSSFSSV